MHILSCSYDELLEIAKRVRVADILSWIQTCRAFASLRDHLTLPLQVIRLATEHDLSSDILELPAGASAVKLIATRPQRFQNLLLQGALNGQSLPCYYTTIQNERIIEAKIVPGGRWLVTFTVSVDEDSEEEDNQPTMCRVWDLDLAQEENDLEPCATLPLYGYQGQFWLRRSTEGNTAQICVCARGFRVIEFDHLDQERPLKLLRIIEMKSLDFAASFGLHGDYVFCVDAFERTLGVLNWVTGRQQWFCFDNSTYLESMYHVLSIGPDGLIAIDQGNNVINFLAMPDSRLGDQHESGPAEASTNSLNRLRCIKQTPIQGIVPYTSMPHSWPDVDPPYSSRQPATAIITFPQHFVYVEYPSNPRERDLDRLPLVFSLPPGSSEPAAFRRAMDGHVVGVNGRGIGFDVHFLTKDGRHSVQSFEQEFGANYTRRFVCPFGAVIGGFGVTDNIDKIYLWKLDASS